MNIRGVQGYLSRGQTWKGWGLYLRKYEGGKVYRPEITIDWVETNEFEASEPIHMDTIENHDSIDQQSKEHGMGLAYKGEIEYLRGEISKLLAR